MVTVAQLEKKLHDKAFPKWRRNFSKKIKVYKDESGRNFWRFEVFHSDLENGKIIWRMSYPEITSGGFTSRQKAIKSAMMYKKTGNNKYATGDY